MKLKKALLLATGFFWMSATVSAQVISLEGRWKFRIGDEPSWSKPEFDDSRWERIWVPSAWEDEGFHGYDGFAWYRTTFDGRKLDRTKTYYVNLGYIDDADEAYLNGMLIGFSGQCPPKFKTAYNTERQYVLPAQVINFDRENTLAIRVFDGVNRGGITEGEVGIYSRDEGARLLINLQGIWSFARSRNGERIPDSGAWEKIMVPSPWEYQGYTKYDGFAWYKRSFTVPSDFTREPLVLILGKIDDFDKVYLNGTFIGSTNDHRPYGRSLSFEKTRVYKIPQELLKRNAANTIEVLVEDMGNIGGIYEGVIGITTQSNYNRYFED